MDTSELPTKSSNEILTELFGAFNAEPPKINLKMNHKSDSEGNESKHSKKSKKYKSKKSKKKHKSKSKKRKRKDSDNMSDSESVKKKKRRNEKKIKKQDSVNIELPVNKVPMALEIMLDGTVGIKGEDGVITKIPDTSKNEIDSSVNDCVEESNEAPTKTELDGSGGEVKKTASTIPDVFDTKLLETGDKQKKGKIQIKDLKFSSVFQETVKAAEEQKKKGSYEEGELSESSNEESNLENYTKREHKRHKHCSHFRSHHRRDTVRHKRRRSPRSRSRSTSPHKFYSRHLSYENNRKKHRSRSRDHSHHHHKHSRRRHSQSITSSYHSRSRNHPISYSRSRSRSRSSHRSKSKESRHSHGKNKDSAECVEKIDKEKLLAIARKNALKLIDAGVAPGAEKLTTIKAGGKTVNELTEYCKKLSEKEALGDDLSDIESESSEDEEKPFHHPFQVRDRPSSIIMNIKNSIPLPVKSLQEKAAEQAKQLRLQFPVSSGSSHRRNESDWVPVSPKKEVPPHKLPILSIPVTVPPPVLPPGFDNPPLLPPPPHQMAIYMSVPPPEPPNKPIFPVIQPSPPVPKLDISSIVSKRLDAIRKLQENSNDAHALNQMYNAQQEMQYWAESKQETGAFTGSTGAKVLSPYELSSGAHAWARRDQLTNASPVRGGMGMALLQKMGWQPGEGLGKNKEGTLEPLKLEVKMDKRGLLAPNESRRGKKGSGAGNQQGPPLPTVKSLDGKHPVSLLNELCSRRRYGIPQFELCFECGPDHKKNFLFKVKVNGVEYTPTIASPNKKQAKAEAAAICLRALGVIPNEPPRN